VTQTNPVDLVPTDTTINRDDAALERAALVDEVSNIDMQLAQRNRCHPDGRRMTPEEYWDWHSKAVAAGIHKRKRIRALNQIIRAHGDPERDRTQLSLHVRLDDIEAAVKALIGAVDQLRVVLTVGQEKRR
jgi:hypothetical protein